MATLKAQSLSLFGALGWGSVVGAISLAAWTGQPWLALLCSAAWLGMVLVRRAWPYFPAAILLFLVFFVPLWLPGALWRVLALPTVIPLLATLALSALALRREGFRWLRQGSIDLVSGLGVLGTALGAAFALLSWALWTHNLGTGLGMVSDLQGVPTWFLLLVGLPAFSLLGSLVEEAIYRGILQEALLAALPDRPVWALALQASAFAAAHVAAGFPSGPIGYAIMLIYGCALGWLRLRSGGMLAPFLAHLGASLLVGITLVMLAR